MKLNDYILSNELTKSDGSIIADHIWWDDKSLHSEQKVALTLQLLDQYTEYEVIMHLDINFDKMNAAAKELMWSYFKDQLSGNDTKQRDIVEHALSDDFFNDSDRVHEAWNAMIHDNNDSILQLLLINSAPVPYTLKDELYQKLIQDETWHFFIFESLFDSISYGYGQIDFAAARLILPKLKIDHSSEKYVALFEALSNFSSKNEYWESLNH